MSFSLYIAALAVSDTAALLSGESHIDVQSYNLVSENITNKFLG